MVNLNTYPLTYTKGRRTPWTMSRHSSPICTMGAHDAIMCWAFSTTFYLVAQDCYATLKPNSIRSFKDFACEFISQFASSCKPKKTTVNLLGMQQKKDESLKVFMAQFNKECLWVSNLIIFLAIIALLKGIRDEFFNRFLSKNSPKAIIELRH